MAEEEIGRGEWLDENYRKQLIKGDKMIVKLTKEQIAILSFAMGLYTNEVYKQNMIIPTDMEASAKTVKEIIDVFNNATEE